MTPPVLLNEFDVFFCKTSLLLNEIDVFFRGIDETHFLYPRFRSILLNFHTFGVARMRQNAILLNEFDGFSVKPHFYLRNLMVFITQYTFIATLLFYLMNLMVFI